MGRDFTPQEQHLSDVKYGFSNQRLVFHMSNGKEFVLRDPQRDMEKRFPNLSFLTNHFHNLYEEGICLEGWAEIEEKVALIVSANKNVLPLSEDQYIWEWYIGKLDPCFYYNETNERVFLEKAGQLVKRKYGKQTFV